MAAFITCIPNTNRFNAPPCGQGRVQSQQKCRSVLLSILYTPHSRAAQQPPFVGKPCVRKGNFDGRFTASLTNKWRQYFEFFPCRTNQAAKSLNSGYSPLTNSASMANHPENQF
ncbi:hypothetical protein, partial [Pseudomonas indica]|uniref:hypothetical protein n=1 Tax=Pseudomonas indica TaxID=137658 RepID=UPI0023F8AA93